MEPTPIALIIIYGALFIATIFAPLQWALVTYFWLANVDLPDIGGGLSVFNLAKAFLLPLYLLWRLRRVPGNVLRAPGGMLWIAFTFYVAIAGLWSLFPAAALKFVGHLSGSLLICVVLVKAVGGRKLRAESALWMAFGAIALAILRWVIAPDFADEESRFGSFVTAQSFAAFIAALYSILLFSRTIKAWIQIPTLAALAAAMLLNGSRMWGASIVLATVLALMLSTLHKHLKVLGTIAVCVVILALFAFKDPLLAAVAGESGNNRIADAITAIGSGDDVGRGLGTYRFRKEINELALSQVAGSSLAQLMFGHGTSNAAAITGSLFRLYYRKGDRMDPNRMLHNEWMRVLYEWGLIGAFLWVGFIGTLCVLAWKGFQGRIGDAAKPLCVYLPGFLVNLAGENILAGAGNAVNIGFLLVLALAYASPLRNSRARRWLRPDVLRPENDARKEVPRLEPQAV